MLAEKKKAYRQLSEAIEAEKQLKGVHEALELDMKLHAKGKKRKEVDEETGAVRYKWFCERKK